MVCVSACPVFLWVLDSFNQSGASRPHNHPQPFSPTNLFAMPSGMHGPLGGDGAAAEGSLGRKRGLENRERIVSKRDRALVRDPRRKRTGVARPQGRQRCGRNILGNFLRWPLGATRAVHVTPSRCSLIVVVYRIFCRTILIIFTFFMAPVSGAAPLRRRRESLRRCITLSRAWCHSFFLRPVRFCLATASHRQYGRRVQEVKMHLDYPS